MRLFGVLLTLGYISASCVALAQAPPARHALLIVNSSYQNLPPQPRDDKTVDDLAAELRRSRFAVNVVRDLTHEKDAQEVTVNFLAQVQPGDVCLVYFSGYAIQAEGRNYLLPIDFDPQSDANLNYRSRSLTNLQQLLEQKRAGLKIILLETALQPPDLPVSASQPGLAAPDAIDSRDMVFAFAAPLNALPGTPAGPEPYLFSQSLAKALAKPGASIEEVFGAVRREIAQRSPEQVFPYYLANIIEPFLFTPRPPPPPPPVKAAPAPPPVDTFLTRTHVNVRDRQEYTFIPAGRFLMGCVKGDTTCEPREKPQHPVVIKAGFWMGVTETTAEAYARWVQEDPKSRKMPEAPMWNKKWQDEARPMVNVSWEQAETFCQWVGGRLPTEAEWEYAARAGKENEAFPLNSENSREKANFYGRQGNDKYLDEAARPKRFDPVGRYGLYDMAGNVWEWTRDYFSETYYSSSPLEDPTGPPTGKERVARGGSFMSDPAKHLRISYRANFGKGGNIVGFRCVLPDSPEVRRLLP